MKTQAWGWLAAAALAAGLNASYHDGGFQWAHQMVNEVRHNTGAVLALATGRADRFLAEAQLVKAQKHNSPCPFAAALAEARAMNTIQQFDQDFDVMSAREEAQLARVEASRARIEAQVSRIRIPAVALNPMMVTVPKVSVCPRIRVNVPRMPAIKMPAMPIVHVKMGEGGSV